MPRLRTIKGTVVPIKQRVVGRIPKAQLRIIQQILAERQAVDARLMTATNTSLAGMKLPMDDEHTYNVNPQNGEVTEVEQPK